MCGTRAAFASVSRVEFSEDAAVERVSVVGISGSGKSTLARRLADQLGSTLLELDAVHHLPGWEPIDVEPFRQEVGRFVAQDRWVVDGNYRAVVADLVWDRADTVVWLDLPRSTVVRRVTWRSAHRVVRREELWNGNRETWGSVLSWDPKRSVVRWAWVVHGPLRTRYEGAMADAADRPGAPTWVRMRSRAEADAWLAALR